MKARNLPITPATVALWTFENTTSDLVSGANIQGSSSSNVWYAELFPGVMGLCPQKVHYTPVLSALQITGDLTVQWLMRTARSEVSGNTHPVCFVVCAPSAPGETEAKNWLYSLRRGNYGGFSYLHESGLGVDTSHEWPVANLMGKTQLISLTRADGVATLYVDGVSWGSATVGSPTGGAECRVAIGDISNNIGTMASVWGSLRIENAARNATQIRNDYNWTLGRYYGRLSA